MDIGSTNRNSHKASVTQVKLLASVLDISIDELLDESLVQGEVIKILRRELGEGQIPSDIAERRERDREQRRHEPECRICGPHRRQHSSPLREPLDSQGA